MQTITIPLSKSVPLGLGPELQKRLFFVSSEILDFALIEKNERIQALEITTRKGNGNLGLADKINHLIESDILKQKVFKPKIVWQAPANATANGQGYYTAMFDTLVARGIAFEPGEGQVGFGEPLISLINYFDRRIKQIAPTRIRPFDHPDLPQPLPIFELFLTSNCIGHRRKFFVVDEPRHIIFLCKSRDELLGVLRHAVIEIAGHTDVERSIFAARKNVNAGCFQTHAGCPETLGLYPRLPHRTSY